MNTDGMPAEQLAAIEQRANAATPGPWESYPQYGHDFFAYLGGEYLRGVGNLNFGDGDEAEADRAFVIGARQDVPALVAEVRRLTAALAAEQATHEDIAALLASYRLLVPKMQETTERAMAAAAKAIEDLNAALDRIAELEPLASRCGHESRGRRCDQSAGHPGDHQALGEGSVSYVWAAQ